MRAFDLGLAALLGKDIYNVGELVSDVLCISSCQRLYFEHAGVLCDRVSVWQVSLATMHRNTSNWSHPTCAGAALVCSLRTISSTP